MTVDPEAVRAMALAHTAGWNSGSPEAVASFYGSTGARADARRRARALTLSTERRVDRSTKRQVAWLEVYVNQALLAPLLTISLLLASCSSVSIASKAEEELLALHEDAMRAHRESNAELLLRSESPDSVSANRGQVTQPTLVERQTRFQQYLSSTRFTEYLDVVPPLVRVSNDGSLGWVIAQVRAAGVQTTQDGASKSLSFESSWIELYERRGGRWYRVGNVSNFKP